ncbi:hypothetical protein V8G54_009124 [Vigna mungo]|uniref:Uncharacterized protein n=1 Tax=Vigna mungo TaxID=3915 RepID=A0AAQ3S3I2_VIGMU
MIALKPIVHASLHAFHHAPLQTVRGSVWCVCKSQESDSEDPSAEGDANSQELLARIAMLQTEKVRLTDFLEERSAYLSQFGEEAKAEFDKIGEDALKELDEAGARVCVLQLLNVNSLLSSSYSSLDSIFIN